MQRREFIIAVGAAAVWPLAADAQQSPMPVIGFLSTRSASDSARLVKAFGKGLDEAGFSEGKNISVASRSAEGGRAGWGKWAAELVPPPVAVLVASGGSNSAVA